jgi:hypothetical protein
MANPWRSMFASPSWGQSATTTAGSDNGRSSECSWASRRRTARGGTKRLPPSALASDHFGELQGTNADAERVRRTIDVLVEGGFLRLQERQHRASRNVYQALSITPKGHDGLAGGIELPELPEEVA